MPKFRDLSGFTFGHLKAISQNGKSKSGGYKWLCVCDCGKSIVVRGSSLTAGTAKSCGCKKNEIPRNFKHGGRNTKLYNVWRSMKQRCALITSASYKYYGKKGVFVCKEWQQFSNFQKWAQQNGYAEGLSIDRIDVNGNYCQENCRWATKSAQANNTSRNRMLSFRGEQKTMSQWADAFGISYGTMNHRIQRGWDMQKIANTPQNFLNENCRRH